MAKKSLYQTDVYQLSNLAQVLAITEKDGFDCIACDTSVFFPEGGGQPSDRGTISCGALVYNIVQAFDENLESDVWHLTDAPFGTFSVGDEVELTIDWDWRFCNMQRHCGEHMLSGTMHSLFGGVNKGFHMGEDYISIDIDIEGRMLSAEELDLAERTVNEAIWADLPVSVKFFEDYEASLSMPVRKQVPHDGEVSVVTVGELADPYDCIACCGTHPSSSAQVGMLAIYKHEPNKGMNRIYFDCGIKAKEKLSADYRLLSDISNKYSCSTSDLMQRLDGVQAEISDLKGRIVNMTSYIKNVEKQNILKAMETAGSAFSYSLGILGVDDILKLGFDIIGETKDKLLVLMHEESATALLFSSGKAKCGALVKEYAPLFNGRGGGRDDNARAVFSNKKDLRQFAEKVV